MNHEVVVLHTLGRVAGARRILSPANDSQLAAAGAGSGAAGHAAGGDGDRGEAGAVPAAAFPLYEGGSMSEILEQAADATAAAAAAARAHSCRGGRLRRDHEAAAVAVAAGDGVPPVLLFHGVCAWAEGQLEGVCMGVLGGDLPSLLALLPGRARQLIVSSSHL